MSVSKIYIRFRAWLNQSVKNKFLFWNIGFWILAVIVLSLTFLTTSQSEIMSDIRGRNIQIASIVSRDINSRVSGILSDVRIFGHHLESLTEDMKTQVTALINLRISSPGRYMAAYLFNSNNNLLLHVDDPIENLLSMEEINDIVSRPVVEVSDGVFDACLNANNSGTYISEVEFTGLDRIPTISIGIPVEYSSGIVRILVVKLDVRDIWQHIDLTTIGNSGFTYAVDRNGSIIAHPDPSQLGQSISGEIDEVLEGFEGFKEYHDPQHGGNIVYAAYSPVGSPTDWGIIVEQDKIEANGPILRTTIIVIIVGLSLATIGTIGILLMMQSFTRPIQALTRTAQEISETGELTKTSMEERPDEVGQLSVSFDQMIDRLKSMEGRLQTAAAEERNRLARDLHDAVSQTLFSASIIAEVLPSLWEKDHKKGKARLEEVRQLTRGALAEMRTLLLELRPSALLEAELPLLLTQLTDAISGRTRIPIKFSGEGECDTISDEAKVALYRIAQEALNNVAKHSEAQNVYVNMLCENDKVILEIIDNGVGFDVDRITSDHLGVSIMRERAEDIGASLTVQSHPGKGTEITVIWENK